MHVLVFDQPKPGHFRRGVEVIAKALDGAPLMAPVRQARWQLVRHKGPLVCQTADDYPLNFFGFCFLRQIFGRRTVGIIIHGKPKIFPMRAGSLVRRVLFALIRLLPRAKIFYIVAPNNLSDRDPAWIFDIEWWDLAIAPIDGRSLMFARRDGVANIVLLGTLTARKGIEFFAAAAHASHQRSLPLHFVLACDPGNVSEEMLRRFVLSGGKIIAPPADDEVFIACLRQADYIWCCYQPPFDRSSGLFGRSIQLGIRSIVREGTYLARMQKRFGGGIAIPYGDVNTLLAGLIVPGAPCFQSSVAWFASFSINRLRHAAGLQKHSATADSEVAV